MSLSERVDQDALLWENHESYLSLSLRSQWAFQEALSDGQTRKDFFVPGCCSAVEILQPCIGSAESWLSESYQMTDPSAKFNSVYLEPATSAYLTSYNPLSAFYMSTSSLYAPQRLYRSSRSKDSTDMTFGHSLRVPSH